MSDYDDEGLERLLISNTLDEVIEYLEKRQRALIYVMMTQGEGEARILRSALARKRKEQS